MPPISIVTHPLCPLAQRLVLVADADGWRRGADYAVVYLAYPTLMETARRYSPDGALPVMLVDGALRSSSTVHIAEYVDRRAGGRMLPADPEILLTVRRREALAADVLDALRKVFTARERDTLAGALAAFFTQVARIDADLAADGTDESILRMDMASIAPIASLALFFPAFAALDAWNATPRFRDIARRIVALPSLIQSRCPNYAAEFDAFFAMTGSNFPSLITEQPR